MWLTSSEPLEQSVSSLLWFLSMVESILRNVQLLIQWLAHPLGDEAQAI
jgi:hypothetical protein